MIEFFRDTLSGPLYFIVAILAIILIMAIIGFILERKLKQEENDSKVAYVGTEVGQETAIPTTENNIETTTSTNNN